MAATGNVLKDFSEHTQRRFTSEQTSATTVVVRRRWSVRSLCLPDGARLIVRPISDQDAQCADRCPDRALVW